MPLGKRNVQKETQFGTPTIFDLAGAGESGLGGGFDIVNDLNIRPWVLRYTYTQGKNVTYLGKSYTVPDGVSFVPQSVAMIENTTHLHDTWKDYYTYKVSTFKITAGLEYQGFKLQAGFEQTKGRINNMLKNNTKYFAFHGGIYVSFALQFKGITHPPLDTDFIADIKRMPAAYNAALYRKFVQAWGTHYFTRVYYGCQFNITVTQDKKYLQTRDVGWNERNMGLTLGYKENQFGFCHSGIVNKSKIDGSFLDGAQTIAQARGGAPYLFTNTKDFNAWIGSCDQLKVPIRPYSDIAPITELISDTTVRANVLRAVIEYGKGVKH